MARLLGHVFLCGLKWCSYSASKCIFTEPGALIGHRCSSSAAWRFLQESELQEKSSFQGKLLSKN